VILVLTRRNRRLLAGALTLCGIAMIAGALMLSGPAGTVAGTRLEPLRRVNTNANEVALTFDISWGTEMPAKVADVLKRYGVKATVFVSGPWASRNHEFLRRLTAEGHELASHGYRHDNMSGWNEAEIAKAVQQTHEIIREASGQEACFIRPPNGDYNQLVLATAAKLGYTVVIWSLDSLDWLNPGVNRIVDRVLRAKPGDVILMHASDTSKQTDQALPAALDGLLAKGLRLVTLRELISRAQLTQ
jgi:polysaccharide deacetylase family sporulation protein PdaB